MSFKDLCFIYAIRDIKKGEMLTTEYVPFTESYKKRKEVLATYNFECECERCQIERVDSSVDDRVSEIMSKYNNIANPHKKDSFILRQLDLLLKNEPHLYNFVGYQLPFNKFLFNLIRDRKLSVIVEICLHGSDVFRFVASEEFATLKLYAAYFYFVSGGMKDKAIQLVRKTKEEYAGDFDLFLYSFGKANPCFQTLLELV